MILQNSKTGKKSSHKYTYNVYGELKTVDDKSFEYDDISGQVTKETIKLAKNKSIVKKYLYDSADNRIESNIIVDGKMSLLWNINMMENQNLFS